MYRIDDLERVSNESREKKRLQMQKYRSKTTFDQKEKVRKYDRERKRCKRNVEMGHNENCENYETSYFKVLKNSKQIREILGKNSKHYSDVLMHVLRKAMKSPSKAVLFKTKCVELLKFPDSNISSPEPCDEINTKLRTLAVLRSKKKTKKAKELAKELTETVGNYTEIAKKSKSNYSRVYRLIRTPKKRIKDCYERKFTEAEKREAIEIYFDDEVLYSLPEARYAHLRFMSCTIDEAYKRHYLVKSTCKRKMSRTTFASLKPVYVRTVTASPLRGCKCEYCQNVGLMRESLIGLGFKGIPKNHSASIEITWCSFRKNTQEINENDEASERDGNSDEFPRKDCVFGRCDQCGVDKFKKILQKQNSDLIKSKRIVSWTQWENRTILRKKPKKPIKRMCHVKKKGTMKRMLNIYITKLEAMSFHQFNKIWQMKQFNCALRNLRMGQVLFVHDFSQNILLYSQDEPLGAHWDHEQIALHPTVAFYVCRNGYSVREEIIHLTPHKKHDHHAVDIFRKKSIQHLRGKGVEIHELIEWTDNAGSQYKCCGEFLEMSLKDMPCSHHFYGVKHGKGPSDRAGGYYKNFVRKTVKSGTVLLTDCAELARYSQVKYENQSCCDKNTECTEPSKRGEDSPHYLKKVIYTHTIRRPPEPKDMRSYLGTREIFSICNTSVRGVLEIRNVSCCCPSCFLGMGECQYIEYADEWKTISVSATYGKRKLKKFDMEKVVEWRNNKLGRIRSRNFRYFPSLTKKQKFKKSLELLNQSCSTDENGSHRMVKKRLDFSTKPKRNSCKKESEENKNYNSS